MDQWGILTSKQTIHTVLLYEQEQGKDSQDEIEMFSQT